MSTPTLDNSIRWFSDNDKILKIDALDNTARMKAEAVGSSTILIQDTEFNILKKIVVDVITAQAVSLGLTSGVPEIK